MSLISLRGKTYDLDAPLRGARAIGEVRGTSPREAYHAAEQNRFGHRHDGRSIVTTAREALEPMIGAEGIARLEAAAVRNGIPETTENESAPVLSAVVGR
jgi:hypothetical protein